MKKYEPPAPMVHGYTSRQMREAYEQGFRDGQTTPHEEVVIIHQKDAVCPPEMFTRYLSGVIWKGMPKGNVNRMVNALACEEIRTIGQLATRTERELLSVPNIGRYALRTCTALLAAHGLHWGMKGNIQEPR